MDRDAVDIRGIADLALGLTENSMTDDWLTSLLTIVRRHPCLVLRFDNDDWLQLQEGHRGPAEFTVTRPRRVVKELKLPTLCLSFGQHDEIDSAYCGILARKRHVSTLDAGLKITSGARVSVSTERELVELVAEGPVRNRLAERLSRGDSAVKLTPQVSVAVVEALSAIETNRPMLRRIAEILSAPNRFSNNSAVQEDAVRMALRAFHLDPGDRPIARQLATDRQSAIARIPVMEDSVIEHDARWISGFDLIASDVTGRARFRSGREELEVFTANRRPLEETFGVDLIYLNLTRRSIAMVQYKMLDRSKSPGEGADWIYRPDDQLEEELKRMENYSAHGEPEELEYRLNPGAFFLKFVKRDAAIKERGILLPFDHYKVTLKDPRCTTGERGGIRVSYESLDGRYLRESAFVDLLRAGYLGTYAATTRNFMTLVEAVLASNRAVVGAVVAESKKADSGDEPQRAAILAPIRSGEDSV